MIAIRQYFEFLRRSHRLLIAGLGATFISSFGQTFFIALWLPIAQERFGLTFAGIGSLYAGATLGSAVLLVYVGRWIDRIDQRLYAFLALTLLSASLLLAAFAPSIAVLTLALLGLRLGGQGLMTHIAMTVISRSFDRERGRALSLVILGFAFGEAVLPWSGAQLLLYYGMTPTLATIALLLFCFAGALFWWGFAERVEPRILLSVEGGEGGGEPSAAATGVAMREEPFSLWRAVSREQFWILASSSLVLPFVATGFFFFQLTLAEEQSWSIEALAVAIATFAVTRIVGTLVSGPLVDRYTARWLFALFQLPLAVGLLLLYLLESSLAAYLFMGGMGFSMGLSVTIKNGAIAESYPLHQLGSIKSLFLSLMVSSTAFSPPLFGWLLDRGVTLVTIAFSTLIVLIVLILWSFRLRIEP